MPSHDYVCLNCKKEFVYFHVRSNDTAACPGCSSQNVEKQFPKVTSTPIFKGSGFHVTDYKKRGKR